MSEKLSLARGLAMIAGGNPAGFVALRAAPATYLSLLAPLVGFALFLALQTGIEHGWQLGLALFLQGLISLLAPPVLAEPFCRRCGRQESWMLYAVALNAMNLAMIGVLALLWLAAALLVTAGVDIRVAGFGMLAGLALYGVWLQWFTARCTLGMSRWRTIGLLLFTQAGTGFLLLPALLAP